MIPLPRPELTIEPEEAQPVPLAAIPHVALRCRVASPRPVAGGLLRCQVRIEPARRRYSDVEAARLADLFGDRARWQQTLRSYLWTTTTALVPAFETSTEIDLQLTAPLDLRLGPARFLFAVEPGTMVPLSLHWSGSVLHLRTDGGLLGMPVPWSLESRFELAVETVIRAASLHGGDGAVTVRRDLLDRLRQFQRERALATLDSALETLLAAASPPRAEDRAA